jgi:prepilin-type N-terminal cleavage/methylation domain-containing protein
MENTPNYSHIKKNSKKIWAKRSNPLGFTLIEILLVIAIFSIVVFAGLPLIRGIVFQNDLEMASLVVVSTLRQAENSSRNGLEDSAWGVRINYPDLILFKGNNYSSRDTTKDLAYTLNSNLTFSGLSEIVYSKMNAIPSTTGNIVITNINNNLVTININAKGRISY